jgi:small subunit ribosomal protein S20
MLHSKSNIKRAKTSAQANLRNRVYRSMMKTAIKRLRTTESKEQAVIELRKASSVMDKMVNKGIIHHNNANRNKSRLAQWVNNHFST